MKRFSSWIVVLAVASLAGPARAAANTIEPQVRLELDLVDGSHISGMPNIKSVPVQTSYAKPDLSLRQILTIRFDENHETVSVTMRNGDKLKGVATLGPIELETVSGKVSVGIEQIRWLRVALPGGELPAGEGSLTFGGLRWTAWRMAFEVQGDKFASLPKPLPDYGDTKPFIHTRGPTLMNNIGSAQWRDYRIDFEYCMRGVDPEFKACFWGPDYRGGSIMFHVTSATNSLPEDNWSMYALRLRWDGVWTLGCTFNNRGKTPPVPGKPQGERSRKLAEGKGLKFDPKEGNRFRIDVTGTRIQVWMDDEQLVDVEDDKMDEPMGDNTLDHGGVGFQWAADTMGWIRNFKVKAL